MLMALTNFGVQGGAVVHLFDSLHKNTKNRIIYTHHEQAAALPLQRKFNTNQVLV